MNGVGFILITNSLSIRWVCKVIQCVRLVNLSIFSEVKYGEITQTAWLKPISIDSASLKLNRFYLKKGHITMLKVTVTKWSYMVAITFRFWKITMSSTPLRTFGSHHIRLLVNFQVNVKNKVVYSIKCCWSSLEDIIVHLIFSLSKISMIFKC